ncbi:DEAD/DEAH box helicase [Carnobacterium sp. ISL-102]|uniref:DEAD/DEAH box helicase n=1 Tax=Carnobacterium sp. ISL-102 TaxID=2819142 RepID=UPI001BE4EA9B|nr:DEAD/DEAH box helicase [Carnobacterium sp. ISL-102]MBT2732040.1 DEAD/DEAH box helicase [Carnobacterium sp. ISL-102]
MLFNELELNQHLLHALEEAGYTKATPIQEDAIPHLMNNKDLLGCAQTGTGKTAAFALPILQNIMEEKTVGKGAIKALILAPTRELAIQIGESFQIYAKYLPLNIQVIFGGVSQNPQTATLKRGTDILVATPGRLLDLIRQGYVKLNQVDFFVLDEADMMLDMGMLRDVRHIIRELPKKRQSMFFSATMPKEIEKLAGTILLNPVKVVVNPVSSTVEVIQQSVYRVAKTDKTNLLIHLLKNKQVERSLVFSRTKHGANKIVKKLLQAGFSAEAIHGNKSQNARQQALENFKTMKTSVLVATDIAARGIDVPELSQVIQFDLPEVPETYVHRIGRTGRAGLSGKAISFCDETESDLLRDIEKLSKRKVPVIKDHPYLLKEGTQAPTQQAKKAVSTRNNGTQTKKKQGRRGGQKSAQRPRVQTKNT